MILYKYLNLKTGISALRRSTVRFTPPSELNDPFETTSFLYEENENKISEGKKISHQLNFENYGILSLSKSPLNPVMWSHYAKLPADDLEEVDQRDLYKCDSHRGIVIGIDTEKAGLENEELNVLPAKYGEVIYSKMKPTSPFENSRDFELMYGGLPSFDESKLDALKRAFLYKSHLWEYEQEVRVIRNIVTSNQPIKNGLEWQGISDIPRDSIVEVYLGLALKDHIKHWNEKVSHALGQQSQCKVYICEMNDSNWDLTPIPINNYLNK